MQIKQVKYIYNMQLMHIQINQIIINKNDNDKSIQISNLLK